MNDSPLHPYIDPELEARVVALVLGEASAFERDELERLVREKPELALFKQRMEEVHGLLTEIGADGAAGGDWKLSSQRRQNLLAALTGADPGSEGTDTEEIPVLGSGGGKGSRTPVFWLWRMAAAACVAFGLWLGKGAFFDRPESIMPAEIVDISIPPAEEPRLAYKEWDKPGEGGTTDRDYGMFQPPAREFQRYPGHTGGPNVAEEALKRSQPSVSQPVTRGAVALADAMGPAAVEGVSEDFSMPGQGGRSKGLATVTADERRRDEATGEVEFKGNVTLRQEGLTLRADSLKADLKPAAPGAAMDEREVRAFSAGGYVEVEKQTPDGKLQVAKSRQATLDAESGKLAFTDFPSLRDGDNLVRGTGEATTLTLSPDGTHSIKGPADYTFDPGQVMDLANAKMQARSNVSGLASQPRAAEDTLSEKSSSVPEAARPEAANEPAQPLNQLAGAMDGLKAAAKENAPAPPGAPVPAEPLGNTGLRSGNLAATQEQIDAALGLEAKPAASSPAPLGESPEDQFTMMGHGGRESQGAHWGMITLNPNAGQGVAVEESDKAPMAENTPATGFFFREGDKPFPAHGYNDAKPAPAPGQPGQQQPMSVTAGGDISVGGVIKNSGSGDVSHFFPILDPRASAAETPPPAPGSNVSKTSVEGFEYTTSGRWSGAKADAPRTEMPGYIGMNGVDDDPSAPAGKLPEVRLGVGVEWDEKSAPQGQPGQAGQKNLVTGTGNSVADSGALLDLRAKKKQDSLNPDKDRLTATIDEFILEAPKLSPEGKSMPSDSIGVYQAPQHGGEAPIELGRDLDADATMTRFGSNRALEQAMAGESISTTTPATPAIPESRQRELKREEAEAMTDAEKPSDSTRSYVSGGTVGGINGELSDFPFVAPNDGKGEKAAADQPARNFAHIGHGGEVLEKSMRELSADANETSVSQVESKSKAAAPVPAEDFRQVGIAGNISTPATPAPTAAPEPVPAMTAPAPMAGKPSQGRKLVEAEQLQRQMSDVNDIAELHNELATLREQAKTDPSAQARLEVAQKRMDELEIMSQKLGGMSPETDAPSDLNAPLPTGPAAPAAGPAPVKGPMGGDVTGAAGIAISRRQERVAQADAAYARGEQLLAGQDYEGAVVELKKSMDLLPNAAAVENRRDAYEKRYADAAVKLARQHAEEGRMSESMALVTDVLAPKMDPENAEAKQLYEDLNDPEIYNPAVTQEFIAKVKQVDTALKRAQSHIRIGDYDGAERAYNEALNTEKYNSAARRGLEEVSKYRRDNNQTAYDQNRAKMLTDISSMWESPIIRYGVGSDVTGPVTQASASTAAPAKPAPKPLSVAPEALNELRASQESFSTFSLHVSDVAFKLAQSALANGQWPETEKVRIEEFVNAFDYGDPTPSREEKVAARLEQAAHPFLQQRNLMRVSLRTASAGRAQQTPLRLTLLLDSSGSMERPDRRASVERAFGLLAAQLQPNDQVTLIGFSRQPRLLADRVSGDKAAALVKLVEGIPSEGGTNLEEALRLARTKALEMKTDGAQNRIVLLTDGAANLGNANPSQLGRMIEEMRQEGLAFDAAGVGSDGVNDEILEALTRKGDGRYYLLHRPEDADDGFARQIAGALRPAAQNVKVQVEFNPKRVERYKLLGFEKHILNKEDFRDDKVDAAELAADEAGVAVYQFEPLPQGEGDIGSISVRFRDMSSGEMVEKRWPIPYETQPPRLEQANPSLRLAGVAAMFGAKLKGDPLGEVVDLQELSRVMASLPAQVRGFERVKQLEEMIGQARNLEGSR